MQFVKGFVNIYAFQNITFQEIFLKMAKEPHFFERMFSVFAGAGRWFIRVNVGSLQVLTSEPLLTFSEGKKIQPFCIIFTAVFVSFVISGAFQPFKMVKYS